jgi:PAS domain S-box-containing protein
MAIPLTLLILEDRPADVELVLHELRRAGYEPMWRRVDTEADFLAALDPSLDLDLILADYTLPQYDALRAFELVRERGLDVPFIIVSGTIGEELAVAALHRGIADYLIKDRLARLGAAVARALQQRQQNIETRRAERALQSQAQLHTAVLNALTAEVAVLDATGVIISVNTAWERFERAEGSPPLAQTGVGTNYLDVCRRAVEEEPASEAAAVLAGLEAVLSRRQLHFILEYYCPTPTADRWFVLHATPLGDRDGIVVVHEEITLRVQAEQALRAAETQYRTLVEHIPAIVYQAAIDEHSSTLYVNAQIEKTLGFTPTEWMANPQQWLTQLHPRDFEQVFATVTRVQLNDAPIRTEFRMIARDGRVVWFNDEAVVIRDAKGQPLYMLGVMLDITARKQAEEQVHQLNMELEMRVAQRTAELVDANTRLRELNLFKDNMLAITSHDLRSPLGAIQSMAEILSEEGSLPEETLQLTRSIYTTSRHLIDIVSKLLDLARLEAGKVQLDLAELYASEVAHQVVDALHANAQAKSIAIHIIVEPDEPIVRADFTKLVQIMSNLVGNAIKFTMPGGQITLTIGPRADMVAIRVADTGLGISADDLPHLFERFQQSHSRGTAGEAGTGLGLTIVRQLVALHGGTIDVASVPQQGSTFTLCLPAWDPASDPA